MTKKYTLITGASSGIGKELAKECARYHHSLLLVARREEKLLELKEELEKEYGIEVVVFAYDLLDTKAIDELYQKCKDREVDQLINNAGFGDHGAYLDNTYEQKENLVKLNVLALMKLTYLFGNRMRERKEGRILNVASVAAFTSGPYMPCYYASKAYVLSFSNALHEELKEDGITVTALCPGPTKTGFEEAAHMEEAKTFKNGKSAIEVAKKGYRAMQKGKRMCCPDLFSKGADFFAKILPRSVSMKVAKGMNK